MFLNGRLSLSPSEMAASALKTSFAPEELAELDAIFGKGSIQGTRYDAGQMARLDSEK